ncbi:hypothetical protein GCM10010234_52740 [Streptomyces hawaiiensis]
MGLPRISLAVSPTGGNRNDVTHLLPLLDKVPAVAGVVGRPRHRPDALLPDRGYDHDKYRRLLRARGIRPVIARREKAHGSGLGIFRYVVERTITWLHGFRRLRIRWNDATTSTKPNSFSAAHTERLSLLRVVRVRGCDAFGEPGSSRPPHRAACSPRARGGGRVGVGRIPTRSLA